MIPGRVSDGSGTESGCLLKGTGRSLERERMVELCDSLVGVPLYFCVRSEVLKEDNRPGVAAVE